MNFSSILIGSDDPKRLAEYYTKLFGKPIYDEGGYVSWQIGSGGMTVGPHDQVHGKNAQPGRLIWNIESDDVQGDFDRFKAAGAIVVREPYKFEAPDFPSEAPEMWISTLADPDDNYFQLATPFQM
jgi:predicted enzyme related to lactoylglutathione lyase